MKFDLNPEVGREKFEFTLNIYNGYNNYKICEDFKKVKKVLLDLYISAQFDKSAIHQSEFSGGWLHYFRHLI